MLGIFRRKKGGPQDTPPKEPRSAAPGWDALEKAFAELYPGRSPKWWEHNGVHRMDERRNPPANPLEAVALYDPGPFWHFVSYGMSDLYAKESEDEWSGFGYEFTFRIAKDRSGQAPLWPVDVMVSLAKAAYKGEDFAPGHTIKTGPLDGQTGTALTALLVTLDPAIQVLETPHGKVALLLLVGVEGQTRERALDVGVDAVVAELSAHNPDLVTRV
jgi:suppressor of fused-like protein